MALSHERASELIVAMVDCNWNTWDEGVPMEITHNILANFYGVITTDHPPRAGHDMSVILAYSTKVNSSIFLQSVYFCTVNTHSIVPSSDVFYNFIILHSTGR